MVLFQRTANDDMLPDPALEMSRREIQMRIVKLKRAQRERTPTSSRSDEPNQPHPRFSRRFKLLAVTILMTGSMLLAEISLRILGIHKGGIIVMSDPHTGYTHLPNRTLMHDSEGHAIVRINSLGFRDSETTLEKPPGVFRIAMLGDSYVEARQVAIEDAVTEQLESRLNNDSPIACEVLNFGMNGFSTAQEHQRLEHFVIPFDPDLVILSITCTNDIRDNHPSLSRIARPFLLPNKNGELVLDDSFRTGDDRNRDLRSPDSRLWRAVTWIASNVRLAGLATEALRTVMQRERATSPVADLAQFYTGTERDLNIFNPNPPDDWAQAWPVTQAILLDMKSRCDLRGIPFIAVIQGSTQQVCPAARDHFRKIRPDLDCDYPERRLSSFLATNNIIHISLADPFLQQHRRTGEHLHGFKRPGIGHWNEKGHQLAAQIIHDFLIEQNLLDD